MKVYMVYTSNIGMFGAARTLQGAFATRELADAKRIEILVTTTNGPDDVTVEEVEVATE